MNEKSKSKIVVFRIEKAKRVMSEIQLLINNELWTTAINRTYYACYHAVSALLIQHGIKTRTHSGTRQMFGLHFVKTKKISRNMGKFYSDIFDMRHSGDYGDFVEYKQEDVLDVLEPARELIKKIELLLDS